MSDTRDHSTDQAAPTQSDQLVFGWSARLFVNLPLYAVLALAFRRWDRPPGKCLLRLSKDDICVHRR